MKTFIAFAALLASLSPCFGDMLGINVEFSRSKENQTLVSIRTGSLTKYNRENVSILDAATALRTLRFEKDGKFAVIHSKEPIPPADLMLILEAMSANHIEISYIQIGQASPTGMDIWNQTAPMEDREGDLLRNQLGVAENVIPCSPKIAGLKIDLGQNFGSPQKVLCYDLFDHRGELTHTDNGGSQLHWRIFASSETKNLFIVESEPSSENVMGWVDGRVFVERMVNMGEAIMGLPPQPPKVSFRDALKECVEVDAASQIAAFYVSYRREIESHPRLVWIIYALGLPGFHGSKWPNSDRPASIFHQLRTVIDAETGQRLFFDTLPVPRFSIQ
jgi:hypothetical protein